MINDQGCKSGLVKKSETMGVQIYAWRVKSGAGSQERNQIILFILNSDIIINDEIITYNSGPHRIFCHQRKYRSHILNCIDINQSEASIYSLLRKASDYSDYSGFNV